MTDCSMCRWSLLADPLPPLISIATAPVVVAQTVAQTPETPSVTCPLIQQVRTSTAGDSEPAAPKLPKWIWYVAAALVIAVGIAILAG